MKKLIPVLCLIFLGSACNVTHPRTASDLDQLLASPKRIAVLRPKIEAKVKYISTPELFISPPESANFEGGLSTGYRRLLEKDGHSIYHSIEMQKLLPDGEKGVLELNANLVQLTDKTIVADPDYSAESIPVTVNAKGLIPKELLGKVDFLVATKGRVSIETTKEFFDRWFRNIGLNLLTLPISLVSTFIPVTLPLSVNISTSIFESSPEDMFISMVVINCSDGRVVYQNDFTSTTIPTDDKELEELAADLLEEFLKEED